MRRWIYYSLAAVIVWLSIFALVSLPPVLSGMFTWAQSFRMTADHWFAWMLFSGPLIWFTWRFPIEGSVWGRRLAAHLVLGGILVVLCGLGSEYLTPPMRPFGELRERTSFDGRPGPLSGPDFGPDQRGEPRSQGPGGPPGDMPRPGSRQQHGPPFWVRAGFNVPIYLSIVSLGHAFFYYRRTQQRDRHALKLETQLSAARLQSLRMQLQPHFLFNTLNAISTLVQTNPEAAQEMIGSLGQLLRISLDSGPEAEVPLEQELKFLNCYLEIAQARFGDRLQVRYEVAPGLDNALVPTFILQPLVENAVRHGIEPATGPGTIGIGVRQNGDALHICIRDTGAGLAGTAQPGAPTGIGIANTQARLQSLYPGRHQFVVRNGAAGGCVAEMEIPFHTEPLAAPTEGRNA